jgi:phosphoglycolate phosphatase
MPLLVFDLDGTLVDSRLDLAESANELLSLCAAPPLPVARIVGMVGEGARVLVERVMTAAGVDDVSGDALERFLEIYDRRLLNHTRAYAGVEAALAVVAPSATLAVLTNKPAHHTQRLLDALDLARWFPGGIVGGDTPVGRKPDPAGLRSLMAAAGAGPDTTLMVGDSTVDIDTAARAGVRICLAQYGFAQLRADLVPQESRDLVAETSEGLGASLLKFLDGQEGRTFRPAHSGRP